MYIYVYIWACILCTPKCSWLCTCMYMWIIPWCRQVDIFIIVWYGQVDHYMIWIMGHLISWKCRSSYDMDVPYSEATYSQVTHMEYCLPFVSLQMISFVLVLWKRFISWLLQLLISLFLDNLSLPGTSFLKFIIQFFSVV